MKVISQKALARLTIIGPLASRDQLEKGELKRLIQEISTKTYHLPGSKRVHVDASTVERWYYAWKDGGVDALEPKQRKDSGNSQLSDEIQNAILSAKRELPSRSIKMIIQKLESNKLVAKGELSKSSVYRLLKSNQLNLRTLIETETIERRRFVAEKCNHIWQADVLHGPRIFVDGKYRKAYLVSFMDDASRLITYSEFRLGETELDIQAVFKQALLNRGIPSRIIIDNGSAYRSGQLQAICARLKTDLVYCRPYEPQGKGKLERWHARFRDEFLRELDLTKVQGLHDLNLRLRAYLDEMYHVTAHDGLENNITPIERWRQDLPNIRHLGLWATKIDELFYHRETRRVRKDGCVSLHGKFFEVPYALAGDYVVVVFDPEKNEARHVESQKGERLGDATLVDPIHNTHRKRQRPEQRDSTVTGSNRIELENTIERLYEEHKKSLIIDNNEEV